jgi:hypothetical protein
VVVADGGGRGCGVTKVVIVSDDNITSSGGYNKTPTPTTWNYLNHRKMVAISADGGWDKIMMAVMAAVGWVRGTWCVLGYKNKSVNIKACYIFLSHLTIF